MMDLTGCWLAESSIQLALYNRRIVLEILDSMYGTVSSGRVDNRGVGQADGMGPAVHSGMLASTLL